MVSWIILPIEAEIELRRFATIETDLNGGFREREKQVKNEIHR